MLRLLRVSLATLALLVLSGCVMLWSDNAKIISFGVNPTIGDLEYQRPSTSGTLVLKIRDSKYISDPGKDMFMAGVEAMYRAAAPAAGAIK